VLRPGPSAIIPVPVVEGALVDPKYADKLADLERRVLDAPGSLDPSVRRAASSGGDLPEALRAYVEKVHRHAYEVTDGDVRDLAASGYSEDQVMELTVAAAFGAARARLAAGLEAMERSAEGARTPEERTRAQEGA
jgi:hypothetical protein